MFLGGENLLRKQNGARKVFAVGWLKRSFTLQYAHDLIWITHGSELYNIIPDLFEYLFAKQDYDSHR